MLTNLADQRLAIRVRHPVLRLDGRLLRDSLFKALFFGHVITLMIRLTSKSHSIVNHFVS